MINRIQTMKTRFKNWLSLKIFKLIEKHIPTAHIHITNGSTAHFNDVVIINGEEIEREDIARDLAEFLKGRDADADAPLLTIQGHDPAPTV